MRIFMLVAKVSVTDSLLLAFNERLVQGHGY